MDPKYREDRREREDTRRAEEGDGELEEKRTPASRPELKRRSRGGTGIGRDLDH
jgi:hypothetical protein